MLNSAQMPFGRYLFQVRKHDSLSGFRLFTLTSCISLLLAAMSPCTQGFAASDQKPNLKISSRNTHKLFNSEDILSGFVDDQSTVRVIVNLFDPNEAKQKKTWKSRASRRALRDKIRTQQEQTLSKLPARQFGLRHLFDNQAGFSGEVTVEGLNQLLDDPDVRSIEPVYTEQLHLAQGIGLIEGMTYRSIYDGTGVAIAVVDTGVDYTHLRLGNGGFPNSKVIGGYDTADEDSDPMPNSQAHGTCCAGIAAGNLGTYNDYIGGVAPGAKIYALKVFADGSPAAYSDDIIAAWDWCVTHQDDDPCNLILVITHSLGAGRYYNNTSCDDSDTAYSGAANNATAAGITILASAGNDGYCDSLARPACFTSTISVGAVYDSSLGSKGWCVNDASCATPGGSASCESYEFSTSQDADADVVIAYSNTASFLDVLAPSYKAYTTDIAGPGGYYYNDYYPSFGGTSAACPYAAGTVAVIQSAALAVDGNYLSPDEVRDILTATGDPITDGKVAITKPRVNLTHAIESFALTLLPPEITSTPVTTATAYYLYTYDVDANEIPVPTFSLLTSPDNMTIEPNTGLIEWTPDYFDIAGDHTVTVQATNSQDSNQQNFQITVLPADNFEDNTRNAMWRIYDDSCLKVWIIEDNNRLEIHAAEANSIAAALYSSNGWVLDTNESFAIQIDFHYSPDANTSGWIGLNVEIDQSYASILAGADGNESHYYYETIADGNLINEQEIRDTNDGTLYIWYDVDSNNLYLSHIGFDTKDAYLWQTTTNPLQWSWISPVTIILAGGAEVGSFNTGQVYLDNFRVISGGLYKWPPVTDLNNDGFIDLGDIAEFTEYWLTEPNAPPDFDADGTVDFTDFAELGLAW